jgi:hypothetical protein
MGPYEQIIHVLNFIAPAVFLAGLCAVLARVTSRWWLPLAPWSLLTQTMVGGVLGAAVLLAGLFVFGVDGKMATYGALVLTCASVQWLMCRAWRR